MPMVGRQTIGDIGAILDQLLTTRHATATVPGVLQLTNDLGGTGLAPTVTQTHLLAPLPPAQGGTGSASVSGGVVTAFGTPTGRPLEEWVHDVINVKAYGAKGDGATDDTAAINAALAAVPSTGATVFFPDGVYIVRPAGQTTWLKVLSNTRITGSHAAIVKVGADVGDYRMVFGPATYPAGTYSDIRIDNLRIDQNPAANTTCDIVAGVGGKEQYAIFFGLFNRVAVENCVFDLACGVNTVALNGPGSMYATVRNNRFRFTRARCTTNGGFYDNSAVYLSCAYQTLIGNTFENADVLAAAVGAMEIHGGPAVCTGNISKDYFTGVNIVTQLASETETIPSNISVIGNTFAGCGGGITLWALTGRTLRNVVVEGNAVSVRNADRAAPVYWGIHLYLDAVSGNIDGAFDGVSIIGNTIREQAEVRGPASPFLCGGILAYPNGSMRNIRISGNTVVDAPCQGLRVQSNSGTATNVVVEGNSFVNAGNDSAVITGFRAGTILYGTLTDVRVERNTYSDTNSPNSGYYSWLVPAGVVATRVVVKGNVSTSVQGGLRPSIPVGAGIEEDEFGTAANVVNSLRYSTPVWPPTYAQAKAGDVFISSDPLSPIFYRIIASGTYAPALVGVTGTCVIGQQTAVLSSTANLHVGDWITIAGSLTASPIVHITGVNIEIEGAWTASATNGAVSFFAPVAMAGGQPTMAPLRSLAYSASIAVDASVGSYFYIMATNGAAFTINAPTNGTPGQRIFFRILNTSGGALGAVTWNASYRLAGAWVSPANGSNRAVEFSYDGAAWHEISRSAADVVN